MDLHFRVHHWVLWWLYLGIACGVVALVNILFRELTRTQETVILAIGVFFWLLGGLVCYACEGIQLIVKPQQQPPHPETRGDDDQKEWHPASEFVLPGTQRRFLPSQPRLGRHRRAYPKPPGSLPGMPAGR